MINVEIHNWYYTHLETKRERAGIVGFIPQHRWKRYNKFLEQPYSPTGLANA